VDTQASSFYGHVMLGLMIHFLYFSQPNVSKTCSFINLCIHPSLFWVFGKIFTAFTLQVSTHFFSKAGYDQWIFFKEKLEIIFFQKHVGFFLARPLIIIFFFFLLLLLFSSFLSYYNLFIFSPFSFSLKRSCERGRTLPTYV